MTIYNKPHTVIVRDGSDRLSQERSMGITQLRYKVIQEDTGGRLLIIEQTMLHKGGPPRHNHLYQDEWFFSIKGEFILEIGTERFKLNAGDSILAPQKVPHVWAYVGDEPGRILIAFTPAGKMQHFFDETAKSKSMPEQDPVFWEEHGMELLGPPLSV